MRTRNGRFKRFAKAARLVGVLAFCFAQAPILSSTAGGETLRVAICTNGEIRFTEIDFGDPSRPQPSHGDAACHGPCLCTRKKPALGLPSDKDG